MKLNKFILPLFLVAGLFITSCGDKDETPTGCLKCTLEIPILTDCEVTICDDAADDVNGDATACVSTLTIVGSEGTREERQASLEALGFTCD